MPSNFPDFPSYQEVNAYLHNYANHWCEVGSVVWRMGKRGEGPTERERETEGRKWTETGHRRKLTEHIQFKTKVLGVARDPDSEGACRGRVRERERRGMHVAWKRTSVRERERQGDTARARLTGRVCRIHCDDRGREGAQVQGRDCCQRTPLGLPLVRLWTGRWIGRWVG
jgi:hypothetical protein